MYKITPVIQHVHVIITTEQSKINKLTMCVCRNRMEHVPFGEHQIVCKCMARDWHENAFKIELATSRWDLSIDVCEPENQ